MPPEKAPVRGGTARHASGHITRGTTNTNRLRRVDRWIAQMPALRAARLPVTTALRAL